MRRRAVITRDDRMGFVHIHPKPEQYRIGWQVKHERRVLTGTFAANVL